MRDDSDSILDELANLKELGGNYQILIMEIKLMKNFQFFILFPV